MNTFLQRLLTTFLIMPFIAHASWQSPTSVVSDDNQAIYDAASKNWQTASTQLGDNLEPFLQPPVTKGPSADDSKNTLSAVQTATPETLTLTMLTLEPGTLKENFERINQTLPNPWSIKWLSENDYTVTGNATVTGKDFYEAIGDILQYYPVRAEFYTKNHVLSIVPRS